MPSYWLYKTEPSTFSIDDLKRVKRTAWEGVRNYSARNNLRAAKAGDLVLFYHSSTEPPGVAGIARVCREAYTDPTQFDPQDHHYDPKSTTSAPRWDMVDVELVEKLPRYVPLETLKSDPALEGMLVARRGMRLSVQPVSREHFRRVLVLGGAGTRA